MLLKKGLQVVPRDHNLRAELWRIWREAGLPVVDDQLERFPVSVVQFDLIQRRGYFPRLALLQNHLSRIGIVDLILYPTVTRAGLKLNNQSVSRFGTSLRIRG